MSCSACGSEAVVRGACSTCGAGVSYAPRKKSKATGQPRANGRCRDGLHLWSRPSGIDRRATCQRPGCGEVRIVEAAE